MEEREDGWPTDCRWSKTKEPMQRVRMVCKENSLMSRGIRRFLLYAQRVHHTQAVADIGVGSCVAGFSARASPLVVAPAEVSVGSGTLAASLEAADEEPF